MTEHKRISAQRIITIFFGGVLVISSVTSFGFFYNFFDTLIPPTMPIFGSFGPIISGLIGVALFDVSCSVWLYGFLYHAETPQQRATAVTMTAAAFIGAAAASVAHISLSGTQLNALTTEAEAWVSLGALLTVILGIVANFGAALNYQRNSLESQKSIRESDRRDALMLAESDHQKTLDGLVRTKVKSMLEENSNELAEIQAMRLTQDFIDKEARKYNPTASPIKVNHESKESNDSILHEHEKEFDDLVANRGGMGKPPKVIANGSGRHNEDVNFT